jgi:hypothetical protein
MGKLKYAFWDFLILMGCAVLFWLSKGYFENKYSLLHLLNNRFSEPAKELKIIEVKGKISGHESLIEQAVLCFPDLWQSQRLILDNRVPQEPGFLINYYGHNSFSFPSLFKANRALSMVGNNYNGMGIGGVIAFPECLNSSKRIEDAKKKTASLIYLLTKKILIKTSEHLYEFTLLPFIATDGNLATWGGLSAIQMPFCPSIRNQALVFNRIGVNMVFGPNADLVDSSYRSRSQMDYVKILTENGILPFMKHFIFPSVQTNDNNPHFEVCKMDLSKAYIQACLWPYLKTDRCIKKPWGIMIGHQVVSEIDPDNSLSLSRKGIRYIDDHFWSRPLTISDAVTMKGILKQKTISGGICVIKSVVTDMVLITHYYNYSNCLNLLRHNDFSEEYNRKAVFKVLLTKYKMGLLKIRQLDQPPAL